MIEETPQLSAEIRRAREVGAPIVALESTVIAHGVPRTVTDGDDGRRPLNLRFGLELEAEVRRAGVIPATIAVIAGKPIAGLDPSELEIIATDPGVAKLSTRDLPDAFASGRAGATTVAATLWLANRAGIHVFATGGIGGVHRGDAADVSADLLELSRTAGVVVCAGAKAILDLPRTREALESLGVLVIGWRTEELPGFYTPSTGLRVDVRVEDAAEVAELWTAHRRLGTPGALLLCVPPPPEEALDAEEVEHAIRSSLEEANRAGVRGKEITPYLLAELATRTEGRTLQSNLALLRNNARVAAAVAVEISRR